MPARLKAQYPQEMTIVLQHQFWDLAVDEAQEAMTVGLSFGGVPCTLRIPLAAITAFADPHVRYGLRFRVDLPEPAPEPEPEPEPAGEPAAGAGARRGARRWSAWTRSAAAPRPRKAEAGR